MKLTCSGCRKSGLQMVAIVSEDRNGPTLWICGCCRRRRRNMRRTVAVITQVASSGVTIKGRIEKMELREGQRVTATVSLKTKGGHDAAYEKGSEAWTSSDPEVATVAAHADNPLVADIDGVDGSENGLALITFTADGDPDADETREIIATLDIVCTQGEAVIAEITTGTPSDIPS